MSKVPESKLNHNRFRLDNIQLLETDPHPQLKLQESLCFTDKKPNQSITVISIAQLKTAGVAKMLYL